VAVASGTDALLLALQAIGIAAGDEVVTTPFTFMATGGSIVRAGGRPVFADIDPATFNLNPAAAEAAITSRTRAILPVDLYGQCAEWERFESIARARGLRLVEDAAQAIGARRSGRPAGSFGDAAAFSFYPTKNLGGMGDGGALTTRDASTAARVRLLRTHGDAGGYDHREIGMNSRLDAFQAAVLCVKLQRLDDWNAERMMLASWYGERLSAIFGAGRIPTARASTDELASHLRRSGIGCAVYYPTPLHLQPCFASLGYRKGQLPESEKACAEALSLPIYPGLKTEEQHEVVRAIASFYGASLREASS
jgi:dTDP-4-amino-4,6-dideoxygalactose transaminase